MNEESGIRQAQDQTGMSEMQIDSRFPTQIHHNLYDWWRGSLLGNGHDFRHTRLNNIDAD